MNNFINISVPAVLFIGVSPLSVVLICVHNTPFIVDGQWPLFTL